METTKRKEQPPRYTIVYDKPKIYGRRARILAMLEELDNPDKCRLCDMCIDMMYSTMINF